MDEISIAGKYHALVIWLDRDPVWHVILAQSESRHFLWRGWIGDVEAHHRAPRRNGHEIVVSRDHGNRTVRPLLSWERRHELSRWCRSVEPVQEIEPARECRYEHGSPIGEEARFGGHRRFGDASAL